LGKDFLFESLIEPNIESSSNEVKRLILLEFDKLDFGSYDYGTENEFLLKSKHLYSF
jgi:hypothetical protein